MSSIMFDVEGFILVGGQSSRMGTDKSQLAFGKQTAVERIIAALQPLAVKIRLVGARAQAEAIGLDSVPDTHERWGALGGIQAALGACHSEWAMIVACDLPLVSYELFQRLWQLAQRNPGAFDAIVPMQPDERPQPLCAFYRREPCSQTVERLIAKGEHKPRTLLRKVRTRWVEFRELADLPGSEHFFLNVNTPDDYNQAKHAWAQLQKRH
jgi:molybdopterin-guanine dinucleotide biosynthesis protein A